MRSLTIQIPDELYDRLQLDAKRRKLPVEKLASLRLWLEDFDRRNDCGFQSRTRADADRSKGYVPSIEDDRRYGRDCVSNREQGTRG